MHFFFGGGGGGGRGKGGVGSNKVSWVMRKLANYPLSSSLSFACHTNKPHPHALPGSRDEANDWKEASVRYHGNVAERQVK